MVDAHPSCHRELPGAVGGDPHGVGRHAVIGVPEGDDVIVASVEAGKEHGQIIGLTPTVDKVDNLEEDNHDERIEIIILCRTFKGSGSVSTSLRAYS